jgi:predicted transcriptional regulator
VTPGQRAGVEERKSLKRRSRLETKYDILKAIKQEGVARPTHIMYKANVSWSVMRDFLDELESQALISAVHDHASHNRYALTEKGIQCLNVVLTAKSLLGENEEE